MLLLIQHHHRYYYYYYFFNITVNKNIIVSDNTKLLLLMPLRDSNLLSCDCFGCICLSFWVAFWFLDFGLILLPKNPQQSIFVRKPIKKKPDQKAFLTFSINSKWFGSDHKDQND